MESIALPLKLLLSIVLGALIGLERSSAPGTEDKEKELHKGDTWGIRTYSLISLLGAVSGLLFLFGYVHLSLITTVSFFILIFIYYGVGGWMIKSMGLTTELGAIFSFLIGYFVVSNIIPLQLVIAISIVIELILSIKEKSRTFALGLKRSEVDAFIGFAIIALVILPFLPNHSYYLVDVPFIKNLLEAYNANMFFFDKLEIINPFKLWFIVALITGIDIFGHILTKISGKNKGVIVTSAVGGFVSSTSVIHSLALKSKTSNNINELVTAAMISNLTSFIQIFVLVAPLNSKWLVSITPVLLTILVPTTLVSLIFYLKDKNKMSVISHVQDEDTSSVDDTKVFSLKHALVFALLLITVRVITKAALIVYGESGFLATSILASFTGLDAVVINLAELANNVISAKYALFTLLCVNATNLIVKVLYAIPQAKKEFCIKLLVSSLVIIGSSFAGYFLLI